MARNLLGTAALLVTALLVGSGPADEKAGPKGDARLDGTWRLVSLEEMGRQIPQEDIRGVSLTIKGNKLISREGKGKEDEHLLVVDTTKKPHHFEFGRDKKAIQAKGIYEVEGDTLKMCWDSDHIKIIRGNAVREEPKRPTAFDSRQGLLGVFKRQKS